MIVTLVSKMEIIVTNRARKSLLIRDTQKTYWTSKIPQGARRTTFVPLFHANDWAN